MSEVPSSTILTIIAVIAAFVVITFVISAYYATKSGADDIVSDQIKQEEYIKNSAYYEYHGSVFDGSEVLSTVRKYQGADIAVMVDNGSHELFFNYNVERSGIQAKWDKLISPKQGNDAFSAAYRKAITSTDAAYVKPGDLYLGEVHADAKTGVILGISFTKKSNAETTDVNHTNTETADENAVYTLILDMGSVLETDGATDTALTSSGFTTTDHQKYSISYTTKDGVQGVSTADGKVMSFSIQKPTRTGYTFAGYRECNESWVALSSYQDVINVDVTAAAADDKKYGSSDHCRYFKADWKSSATPCTYKVEYYFEINGTYPETPDIILTNQAAIGSTVTISTDLTSIGTVIASNGSNRLNTAYNSTPYNYTGSNTFAQYYRVDDRSGHISVSSGKAIESTSDPLVLKLYYRQYVHVSFDKGEGSREQTIKTATIPYGGTLADALNDLYGKVDFPSITPLTGWTVKDWKKYKLNESAKDFTTPSGKSYQVGMASNQFETAAQGDVITEDTCYRAEWNTPEYTITIHVGTGTLVNPSGWTRSSASTSSDTIYTKKYQTQSINPNGAIALPSVKPSSSTKSFWYWEEDGYDSGITSVPTYVSGSNVGFNGTREFKAIYTDDGEVVITIDGNGGYVSGSASKDTQLVLAGKPGTTIPSGTLKNFIKDGYEINTSSRYYTSKGGAVAPESDRHYVSNITTFPSSNATYYVHWKASTYQVKCYNDDGSALTVDYMIDHNSGHGSTIPYTIENDVIVKNPSKSKYTFDGWTVQYTGTDGRTKTEKQNTLVLTAGTLLGQASSTTITITANWIKSIKDTYTVEFYDERWSSPINTSYPEEGDMLGTLPTPPSRTGYVFVGWYKTQDNTNDNERQDDGSYTGRIAPNDVITQNTKLYAHWSEIIYICHKHSNKVGEETSVQVRYSKLQSWLKSLPDEKESSTTKGGCYTVQGKHKHTSECYGTIEKTVTWTGKATKDGVTCPYCSQTIYGNGETVKHTHIVNEDSIICGRKEGQTEYSMSCGYTQGQIIGTVPR